MLKSCANNPTVSIATRQAWSSLIQINLVFSFLYPKTCWKHGKKKPSPSHSSPRLNCATHHGHARGQGPTPTPSNSLAQQPYAVRPIRCTIKPNALCSIHRRAAENQQQTRPAHRPHPGRRRKAAAKLQLSALAKNASRSSATNEKNNVPHLLLLLWFLAHDCGLCAGAVQRFVGWGALSQTASLALPLQEAEDVALADGALDVTDDRTGRVVQELHANLPTTIGPDCKTKQT